MGVYVKGIKMPTRCHECHFNVAGWCYATDRIDNRTSFVTDYPIQPWCPLVSVPEHGRCIDADVLEYEEAYLNGHYELGDVEIVTRKDIESAPTIIPADLSVMEYPQVPGITPTVIAEKGDDRTTSTPVWTNYDRLIFKTPEEIALFIHNAEAQAADIGSADTVESWLDWLKSSADKEN